MLEITTLEDIAALQESFDIECKLAAGKDGKGAFPKSVWETYSAFANSYGGDILLGLKEKTDGHFELNGIIDIDKVQNDFWTGVNNVTKVSTNILQDDHVRPITIDSKTLLHIHVPQASRKQKPVFINGNPLTGTYKRLNSADIRQPEEVVKRMLAEQQLDSLDDQILKGFTLGDLDQESLTAYRQHYKNLQPDHPWTKLSDLEFLKRVGGFRQDRTAGIEGLTRAGLLMFGQQHTIKEALPYYMLDYQERVDGDSEVRWIDRITPDGTWPGNLFEFYLRVSRKLTADLKVPFQLIDGVRQAETLVHKVLREALVNMLIHADYTDRASIRVIKRPDRFEFRNPGLMRVPIEKALQGGESDCRNRILQDLFRYIGFGESAGSGLPKILDGWAQQHWRKPLLHEESVPYDQTLLELHMLSLLPDESINELRERLGEPRFNSLTDDERLILATALIEKTVDHQRMMTMLSLHPRDLSSLLADLVHRDLLVRSGGGRGAVYCLFYDRMMDEFKEVSKVQPPEPNEKDMELLRSIAEPVASKKKVPKETVESVIFDLCSRFPMTKEALANLLDRTPERLAKSYLTTMVKKGHLAYWYPTIPQHPQQRYRSCVEKPPGGTIADK